jgi:CRISPR/Cas system-associated exonuclease Cas4 (RecB family)
VKNLTCGPTYFLAGNIAKQKWCHFEAIIRCRENEDLARRNVEKIRENGWGRNYYDVPVVEPLVYVIPNLRSLLPINKPNVRTPPGESFEKVLDLETGETVLYARLDPAKFEKHFGEFFEPVKITYSEWRSLCSRICLSQQETGDTEHFEFAEKHPTIIAFWEWENRYIVGFPDGLTDEFVYEFRSVNSYYLLHHLKPVALAQAGLYAYFLDRPKIRVQIRVKQANKIETFEQKSNPDSAVALLKSMLALLDGSAEPIPPGMAWKCKSCSFRTLCPHLCPA